MNDGKNGLMAPMLIAAPVIFAEKEVDLKGKKSLGRSVQDHMVSVSCTGARWVCMSSPAQ